MSKFAYRYSAPTEEERKEESKLSRLRRLDRRVKTTANIWALTVGIIACLTFGTGLSAILVWQSLAWGIPLAAIGIAGMIFAQPLYKWAEKRGKKKYGEEIIKLSEELLSK